MCKGWRPWSCHDCEWNGLGIQECAEDEDCETVKIVEPERATSRFMKKLAALTSHTFPRFGLSTTGARLMAYPNKLSNQLCLGDWQRNTRYSWSYAHSHTHTHMQAASQFCCMSLPHLAGTPESLFSHAVKAHKINMPSKSVQCVFQLDQPIGKYRQTDSISSWIKFVMILRLGTSLTTCKRRAFLLDINKWGSSICVSFHHYTWLICEFNKHGRTLLNVNTHLHHFTSHLSYLWGSLIADPDIVTPTYSLKQ